MKVARRRVIISLIAIAGTVATAVALAVCLHGTSAPLLQPGGRVAQEELNLMVVAVVLSVVVVVPTFVLLIAFAVRYRVRDDAQARPYSPNLKNNRFVEIAWWIVPSVLICILSVVGWTSSHELDPYAPLTSNVKPLTVQVIALDWKWLFIYPDEGVASVNSLVIPTNTPVHFVLTSDAPMNSLWIPQLSGQIYAMPGMQTQLNIEASSTGTYSGLSANLSGDGFSGMRFQTKAVTDDAFQRWVHTAQQSPHSLDSTTYAQLRKPSQDVTPVDYRLADATIFKSVISRYMGMGATSSGKTP
ncbi:MAG: ubiquinol oxidase subunit II [Candidatus Dormibacteria bacterium]